MKYDIKVLVCYNMDEILSNDSIEIINQFNTSINTDWVNLEYGINYWQLKDSGEPYNGYFRDLNSDPVWVLPFLDGMPFDSHIDGVYDIFTKEEYEVFKKTLDPLTEEI